MKKVYQFITIEQTAPEDFQTKKPFYTIRNNKFGDVIRHLYYYPAWRLYVFTSVHEGCIFSAGCLKDITDFLTNHAGKPATT